MTATEEAATAVSAEETAGRRAGTQPVTATAVSAKEAATGR